ncbi:MAG: hypothetical protein AAB403_03045 [Planctomycetota bacterium]
MALEAIAGAMPALGELKERTLTQAIGSRQRSILEPLIETRLDWAADTLGRPALRATDFPTCQSMETGAVRSPLASPRYPNRWMRRVDVYENKAL